MSRVVVNRADFVYTRYTPNPSLRFCRYHMMQFRPSSPENWQEIWKAVYSALQQDNTINPQQLMLWIEPLRVIKVTEKDLSLEVLIGAQNDFAAQWVRDHFLPQLENAFAEATGKECLIKIEVAPHDGLALFGHSPNAPAPTPPQGQSSPLHSHESRPSENGPLWGMSSKVTIGGASSVFDPKYTFETFVVGASNQFAHASAYAVAENPARQYNPLFLYSSPGLGKTHLLHAIANHFLQKSPNARVLYISAERFVNELIESIQHNKMSQFRSRYRDSYDVILFDDIYLPDDVATFIATYVKSNVRELEGVLIKLQAHASLTGSELSLDLARQQLRFVVPEQSSSYTIESIQSVVTKHFRLKPSDFKSNSKLRSIARPRQIAMFLIRKYTSLGFKEIGQYFGGRDHTTIMHACREIEKKMEQDPEMRDTVETIQNLL
ncbi:MAG: chromosomal replication initiator protein DnaA [Proteobacteria bacterium]|nr:MAG: chromosomal replication initiator protein DnaA [Pseudomonadota bacterium]